MDSIMTVDEFNRVLSSNTTLLAFFGTENCSVCYAVKPKVEDLMKMFPGIYACYCPADHLPVLTGQLLIFTLPAVLIFHNGREYYRSVRFIDLLKIEEVLFDLSDIMEIDSGK